MNCTDIAQLAPLYLSGELDAERKAAFAAHCKTCPACGVELAWRQQLDGRLREAFTSVTPDTSRLDRSVRDAIAAEQGNALRSIPPPVRGTRRWVIAAIGAAAVLLLAGLTYRHLLGSRVPPVFADAALDHQLEVVQQQPRPWTTQTEEILELADKQGVPASDVTALSSGSYQLKAAKLCYLDNRVFLHLVFADGSQQFSIFLRQRYDQSVAGTPREKANGREIYAGKFGSDGVAAFNTETLTAVIVADPSTDAALKVARFAASKL